MGLKVARVSCSVCGSATQSEQHIFNCRLGLFTFGSHLRTAIDPIAGASVGQAMRPCERAACRHCGLRVGLFGVNGLGFTRRWHEARCSSRSSACTSTPTTTEAPPPDTAEMATGRNLLPQVDYNVDVQNLSLEAMIQTLFMSRDDLLKLHEVNPELFREVLNYVVVTWRPGAFSGAPLRPALGLGPGRDDATVVVRAFVPALRAICEQHVSIECLDNQFVKSAQYDEMVDFGEDLREVALQRCLQLQQVACRPGSAVASRGGG